MGDQTFDLAHLDPMTFATPSDRLRRPVVTWCRFTTHCFTRSAADADGPPFVIDEGRRRRVFCPDRHALSAHLPAAMRMLEDPNRYVSETAAERNWIHRAEILVETGSSQVIYQVFFSVKKARRADPFDVELTVESAYAFDPLRLPKLRGRMKIASLLTAMVEGKKPHTKGGRT